MATLDPPLNLLRSQILACTDLELAEIGWVGDPDHASRESAHNPEYPPPPGNPPYEVDAIDVPHKPSRGADVGLMAERLRLSALAGRERRLRLVIFNGRQWSNYDHAEGPRYTWRKYYGSNQHTEHGHFERTDERRDDLHPWEIDMFDAEALRKLNFVYSILTTGGDISCGRDVPEAHQLPGLIAKVPRQGNSIPEQFNSVRLSLDDVLAKLGTAPGGGTGGDVVLTEADREAIAQRAAALVLEGLGALRFESASSLRV
jgi:hypothetical protein